jgi:hypothetical protein
MRKKRKQEAKSIFSNKREKVGSYNIIYDMGVEVRFSRPIKNSAGVWTFQVFVNNNLIHTAYKKSGKFGFGHARAFAKKMARNAVGKYTASYTYNGRQMLSSYTSIDQAKTFAEKARKYPIFKNITLHDPLGHEITNKKPVPVLKSEMVAS